MSSHKTVKVIIIGVGNSGTKLIGTLINELLSRNGFPLYYYEPLYWRSTSGESDIVLNPNSIKEHIEFPLLPDDTIISWPWMDQFIDRLDGLAKFIRAGSRIRCFYKKNVKIIWITRELYSYLASMQKNFPRCLPHAGWHHRPGQYDDYQRLADLYSKFDLKHYEDDRIAIEATWWHLHNSEPLKLIDSGRIYHVCYEDLCREPDVMMHNISRFIGTKYVELQSLRSIYSAPQRKLNIKRKMLERIEMIAGELNRVLYG